MPTVAVHEIVEGALYDEVRLQRGSNSFYMFTNPVGMADVPPDRFKSFLLTNMLQPGTLESPKSFNIKRINVLFLREDRPLRIYESALYRKTFISLEIMDKISWRGPAWMAASPFALFGSPREEIEDLEKHYGIAWERVGAGFPSGIDIHRLDCFMVRIEVPSVDEDGISVFVHLDGKLSRAVV